MQRNKVVLSNTKKARKALAASANYAKETNIVKASNKSKKIELDSSNKDNLANSILIAQRRNAFIKV